MIGYWQTMGVLWSGRSTISRSSVVQEAIGVAMKLPRGMSGWIGDFDMLPQLPHTRGKDVIKKHNDVMIKDILPYPSGVLVRIVRSHW